VLYLLSIQYYIHDDMPMCQPYNHLCLLEDLPSHWGPLPKLCLCDY
jgi:hypothetical protein